MTEEQGRFIPERVRVIRQELDDAAFNYASIRDEYQRAQVAYETERERLISLKKIGAEMMGWLDWFHWQMAHPTVRFTGQSMGDAILQVLRGKVHTEIGRLAKEPNTKFQPWVNIDDIVGELEAGGYEFRSIAPQREVNAALINLVGVEKYPQEGVAFYKAADAEEIYTLTVGKEPPR